MSFESLGTAFFGFFVNSDLLSHREPDVENYPAVSAWTSRNLSVEKPPLTHTHTIHTFGA